MLNVYDNGNGKGPEMKYVCLNNYDGKLRTTSIHQNAMPIKF